MVIKDKETTTTMTVIIMAIRPFVVTAKLVHPAIMPNAHDLSVKVAMIKTLSNKSSRHLSSLHCMMDALTSHNKCMLIKYTNLLYNHCCYPTVVQYKST